jgi:histidine triad (HIT) family protein
MQHPRPEARVHLLLIPKRDIKNIGEITEADQEFVMGCFALVSSLATKNNAQNYRLLSNGPALQHVTYLHFHFMAK